MKRNVLSLLIITILLLTACGGNDATHHYETYPDISRSAVHSDTVLVPLRPEEVTRVAKEGAGHSATERITRSRIIEYAMETYDVSEEWCIWLIGTTWNEGYQQDRYLEYAWACEVVNCYRYWSVSALDCIWGAYYSIGNAYSGYYAADDTTLEMVWLALTDTDTRIVEVDGMIRWDVPGYYLIYDSEIYNCQVWGGN